MCAFASPTAFSERPFTMTRAPSRASPVAMANPMPLVEPETRAVLSVSCRFISIRSFRSRAGEHHPGGQEADAGAGLHEEGSPIRTGQIGVITGERDDALHSGSPQSQAGRSEFVL